MENKQEKTKRKSILFVVLIAIILVIAILIAVIVINKNKEDKIVSTNEFIPPERWEDYSASQNPVVTLRFNDIGKIQIQLYQTEALNSVENFLALCNKFYQGKSFNVKGEDYIQLGYDEELNQGYATLSDLCISKDKTYYTIAHETNDLTHEYGTVSFVRDYDDNTASFQFFITTDENASYDEKYTVIGKVITGYDVLDQIFESLKQNTYDEPNNEPKDEKQDGITIDEVTVETFGSVYEIPIYDIFN